MADTEEIVLERDLPAETRRQLFAALVQIRYGSIEIVIHDGKIVQIARTEKIRFASP